MIYLQEGAAFKSFLLVHKGEFREKELTEELMAPGKIPGSSGTRNLSDNLSDLKAQIAANHKVGRPRYESIINSPDLIPRIC